MQKTIGIEIIRYDPAPTYHPILVRLPCKGSAFFAYTQKKQ